LLQCGVLLLGLLLLGFLAVFLPDGLQLGRMGFGSFNTARRTLRGYETMNMIRKGQVQGVEKDDVRSQVEFVSQIFGVVA